MQILSPDQQLLPMALLSKPAKRVNFVVQQHNPMELELGYYRAKPIVSEEMLPLLIVLLLVFGAGGGYYGYGRWGSRGGTGIGLGTILPILLVAYMLGGPPLNHSAVPLNI